MAEKRKTTWYIYSRDGRTNEYVAAGLLGLNSQEAFSVKECADGERRPLCQVPDYPFVARMLNSKVSAHLDFDVYRTQTSLGSRDDSKPSLVPLPFGGRGKKTTKERLEASGIVRRASPATKRATQF